MYIAELAPILWLLAHWSTIIGSHHHQKIYYNVNCRSKYFALSQMCRQSMSMVLVYSKIYLILTTVVLLAIAVVVYEYS